MCFCKNNGVPIRCFDRSCGGRQAKEIIGYVGVANLACTARNDREEWYRPDLITNGPKFPHLIAKIIENDFALGSGNVSLQNIRKVELYRQLFLWYLSKKTPNAGPQAVRGGIYASLRQPLKSAEIKSRGGLEP